MEPARARLWTAFFVLWVGSCLVLFFLPLSLQPASFLTDDGDALQAAWIMGWVAHCLPRDPLRLFDANVYFPHPLGLAYSEHLIPQGLAIAVFMRLGASLILAYNLLAGVTLLSLALAARIWARELGACQLGAAVAGAVCALSTFSLEEVSRPNVLAMQWIPLGLFFLHRFFVRGALLDSVGFAACFLLQGLSGHYYLVSFPIYLALVLIFYWVFFPERRDFRHGLRLGLPLLLAGLVFVPVELPYLEIFSRYRFRQELPEGTDLARFVVPAPDNLVYHSLFRETALALPGTSPHFAGYLPLLLALVGMASLLRGKERESRRRWLGLWLAAVGVFFAILAGGAELRVGGQLLGAGPYGFFYDHVPFFRYARVPERFAVYFTFGLALAAGLGATALGRRLRGGFLRRAALVLALLLLLPLEHARLPRPYPRIPDPEEAPLVYRWLGQIPGDFAVVEFPVYLRKFLRFYGYEDYFSTFHWKRIPFGRSSFYPPALEYLLWSFRDFPSRESTRLLQTLGVRLIVYHPLQDPNSAGVIRRLQRDPHYTFVRGFPASAPPASRLGYGEEVVFQVLPQAMPPEPPRLPERAIPSAKWRFETSSAADPRLAVDGNLETSWSSGRPQEKGQFFQVDLGGEHVVSRISLGFVYPYSEFPRSLAVNGYHRLHRWRRLELRQDPWEKARLVKQLVADPAKATLDLVPSEPLPLERLRLFIRQTDPIDALPEWRIPEIRVYEVLP